MSREAGNAMAGRRHVFLDIDGLSRWDESEIGQRFPHAEKVAVTGLDPGPAGSWDARTSADYPHVLYEDGRFRMWYTCMPDAQHYGEDPDHMYTCYAESEDGLHWAKPDLGITAQDKWPGNNLLALPGAAMGVVQALPGSDFKYLAAVIQKLPLDPGVTDVPGNRADERGTLIFASDDGLRWHRLARVCQHGDCATLFADHAAGRYLLYQKAGLMHGMLARRCHIGLESTDGVHWEGYGGVNRWRECFVPDDFDDLLAMQRGFRIADYYGVTIHRVGETYISVENLFTMGTPLVSHFGQSPAGLSHLRLGFSHDAFHWRHPVGRPAWMDVGAPGEFDAGFIAPGAHLVECGEETRLYYGGLHYRHGWCIDAGFKMKPDIALAEQQDMCRLGMARIKRDRFASLGTTYRGRFEMDTAASGAEPLCVQPGCPQLYVNARCPNGSVRVALMASGTGAPLPGFAFEDCIAVTDDHVRAPVRYAKADTPSIAPDTRFYLAFELEKGEIFGYEWGARAGAQRPQAPGTAREREGEP